MEEKDKIEELVASGLSPEELAKAWEEYVRSEVNALLDIFLPEAVNGNVGVLYQRPIKRIDVKTNKPIIDETKATAVDIHVVFQFPKPVEFFEEKPIEE